MQHRKQLRYFLTNKELSVDVITQLPDIEGISGLILDFDGVLASHAELYPRADVLDWLVKQSYESIYILSNKPLPERIRFFKEYFPNIKFICGSRKKPYPDGLEAILEDSNEVPDKLLVVDDRLATGIVASVGLGMKACYIRSPYTDFVHRPLRELGFSLLRLSEKTLIRVFGGI